MSSVTRSRLLFSFRLFICSRLHQRLRADGARATWSLYVPIIQPFVSALTFLLPQLSKALGNEKPDLMVKIERGLWAALLDVATGRKDIVPAMYNFFSTLPAADLDNVAAPACDFFKTGGYLLSIAI
jgi:hypothetical protein